MTIPGKIKELKKTERRKDKQLALKIIEVVSKYDLPVAAIYRSLDYVRQFLYAMKDMYSSDGHFTEAEIRKIFRYFLPEGKNV